jgi:hypothetical protein
LRLIRDTDRKYVDSKHFYCAAATAMRRILIEEVRRKARVRHGGLLERVRIRSGFDLIRAFLEVVSGDGPAVSPQHRPDVEHARAAPVEVGFIVHGELPHVIAQVEQAEVAGADDAAAGADDQFTASLEHIEASVVEKGTRRFPRAADADVIARVGAATAAAVSG